MGGSAKGDFLLSGASTGEWTVVASANRAVRGLFNDETELSEEFRFPGAVGGCVESAIAFLFSATK